jgi:hypothetical protein
MNIKKNYVIHQKSKSINNKLSLKEIDLDNNLINGQSKNITNRNISINENKDKNNKKDELEERGEEINFAKTIDELNQSILDLYYDKNSSFKKKIDDLNLKFYLETEKYLNNCKINDHIRNQKLQANLFIILFQQINVFIEEIERLNKIIIDTKYKKEKILERTNELNEKKKNILIKDNLIQSLKKSNTNTERKLLETLLHEDKLIKDNERLRKENETYKTLTIVFENELKNTVRQSGLTPQKNKISRHIKTYSDYGLPTNSIINELCGHSNANNYEERYETINNDNKIKTRDNKKFSYVSKKENRNIYSANKNNYSINIDKNNNVNSDINRLIKRNKIDKNQTLTENNYITKEKEKRNVIKFSPNNFKLKLKQNHNNKIKIKIKKDLPSFNKIDKNIINKKNNFSYSFVNNNNSNSNNNISGSNLNNNSNKDNNSKNKKINVIVKKTPNGINLDSISNNINSTVNTNTNTMTMTETNNLSFEKKDKNVKKIEPKKKYYHKKQKTMSEISFHEIARIHNINEEMYNTINNNNRGGKYNNNKINVKKNEERNINIVKKSPHNKNTYKKTNFKK